MHLLFTQVHFLFWEPGRVVGQYTTTQSDTWVSDFWKEAVKMSYGSWPRFWVYAKRSSILPGGWVWFVKQSIFLNDVKILHVFLRLDWSRWKLKSELHISVTTCLIFLFLIGKSSSHRNLFISLWLRFFETHVTLFNSYLSLIDETLTGTSTRIKVSLDGVASPELQNWSLITECTLVLFPEQTFLSSNVHLQWIQR